MAGTSVRERMTGGFVEESTPGVVGNEPEPVPRQRARRVEREPLGVVLAVLGVVLWPLWLMAIPVCRGEIRRKRLAGRSTTLSSVALGVSIAGLAFTALLYLVLGLAMCSGG